MIQTKIISIKKEKTIVLSQFVVLMGIALAAPLIQTQLISGTIVNLVLFVSTAILGIQAGILIGLLPSLFALATGLLPITLAPLIPFIIIGNIILVVVFNFLKEKNYWSAIILAGFFKFIFLFSVSSILINLFLEKQITSKAALMISWSQLFTVLAGGLIAFLFLKKIKKIK